MLGPGKMPTDDDTAPARILPRSPGFILAIAMAVAVFACTRDLPKPAPTFPPLQTATPTTSPVLATQPSIEAVFSLVPSLPSGDPLRPPFEHLPKDSEPIARLAPRARRGHSRCARRASGGERPRSLPGRSLPRWDEDGHPASLSLRAVDRR